MTAPAPVSLSPELWSQPARRFFTQLALRKPPEVPEAPWGEQRAERFFARLRAGSGLLLNKERTACGDGFQSLEDTFGSFKWE
jgi:hypothetical protein